MAPASKVLQPRVSLLSDSPQMYLTDRLAMTWMAKKGTTIFCLVITLITFAGPARAGTSHSYHMFGDGLTQKCRLIAIMLSRLRMTVDDCIEEYVNLGGKIFGKPRHVHQLIRPLFWMPRTKYDANKLRDIVRLVTERRGRRDGGSHFVSDQDLCRT